MPRLAVTALGADRPGIIARVTGVLLDRGGNLEDSSMTILGGQFAIMLLVEAESPAGELEQELGAATADLGLVVAVREVGAGAESPSATHMLSVYGSDRPGLVHAAAQVLAALDVNVSDVTAGVLEGEQPVYAMLFEVALPAGVDADDVSDALRQADGLAGAEVRVAPLDVTAF